MAFLIFTAVLKLDRTEHISILSTDSQKCTMAASRLLNFLLLLTQTYLLSLRLYRAEFPSYLYYISVHNVMVVIYSQLLHSSPERRAFAEAGC